jgi:hypothetical protein
MKILKGDKPGGLVVYMITQDVSNLRGRYLTRAIVSAASPEKAVTALRRHFFEQSQPEYDDEGIAEVAEDEIDVPIVDNERLTVEPIASGARERWVVAETGEDN